MNKQVITKKDLKQFVGSGKQMILGLVFLVTSLVFAAVILRPYDHTVPKYYIFVNIGIATAIFVIFGVLIGLRIFFGAYKKYAAIKNDDFIIEKDKLVEQEWINNSEYYRKLTFEHNVVFVSDTHSKVKNGTYFYVIKIGNGKNRSTFVKICNKYELSDELLPRLTSHFEQEIINKPEIFEEVEQ